MGPTHVSLSSTCPRRLYRIQAEFIRLRARFAH
ncbi:uncharacterized protein G2W53_040464 [Senna tora]|uniref:Uncharacterized protein n=1 Tax=Senna tora TaxID=362788 RepID=A0A834SD32_9FABA|nr:uncharacterized protein G2W53_040464 [Senna tora]